MPPYPTRGRPGSTERTTSRARRPEPPSSAAPDEVEAASIASHVRSRSLADVVLLTQPAPGGDIEGGRVVITEYADDRSNRYVADVLRELDDRNRAELAQGVEHRRRRRRGSHRPSAAAPARSPRDTSAQLPTQ